MDYFREQYLSEDDICNFAAIIKLLNDELGMDQCWCVKKLHHPAFSCFRLTHKYKPLYQNKDARYLAVALTNRFPPVEEGKKIVLVRRHICKSTFCLNPAHYYYGSQKDVKLELAKRRGKNISDDILQEIRTRRESNKTKWTYENLGEFFNLPYHVVRRICLENAYSNDD